MKYRSPIILLSVAVLMISGCAGQKPVVEPTKVPPPVVSAPPPEAPPVVADSGVFHVSEELYQATFKEIEELIAQLNKIIQDRKYDYWLTYLDPTYIKAMSDPRYLKTFNESPILKKYSIKLSNLNDFFEFVVVPSRSNAKLDEIVFLDENRVMAYMYIKNEKTILYQLRYDGKKWKISLW